QYLAACHVGQDERPARVHQPQALDQQERGDQREDGGNHQQEDHEIVEELAPREGEAREGVGGETGQHHYTGGGGAGDDHAVEHIRRNGRPGGRVVLKVQRPDRQPELLVVLGQVLERGNDHKGQRIQGQRGKVQQHGDTGRVAQAACDVQPPVPPV